MASTLTKKEILPLLNNITFNKVDKFPSILKKKELKRFIYEIVSRETFTINYINLNFCSDETLLQINQTHLYHDYYTDIITFELNDKNEPIEADIYISLDRVKDNAIITGSKYYTELHRVIFHGVLHLCGYKDKTMKEKLIMREKENHYLNLWFDFKK